MVKSIVAFSNFLHFGQSFFSLYDRLRSDSDPNEISNRDKNSDSRFSSNRDWRNELMRWIGFLLVSDLGIPMQSKTWLQFR